MAVFLRIFSWLVSRGDSQTRLMRAVGLVLGLNIAFGLLFFFAERGAQEGLTLDDSIWWAMVTMTTVGYGDISPVTFIGRYLVAYPCFLIGIGLLAYLVGVLADAMIQRVSRRRRGLMSIDEENHVLICHCPNPDRVLTLVEELRLDPRYAQSKFCMISPDYDEAPDAFRGKKIIFVKGNPAHEEVLMRANAAMADGAVILSREPGNERSDVDTFAIGNLIDVLAREKDRDVKIVVELLSENNSRLMERAHVDGLVSTTGINDNLLIQEYLSPGIHDVFQQLITNSEGSQFYVYPTKLQGHKFRELQVAIIEHDTDMQVIGLIQGGKPVLNPPRNTVLADGDKLVLLAHDATEFDGIEKELLNQ